MDFPKSVPGVGLVNNQFVDEDPVNGTPGSLIPAKWGNDVTKEMLAVIQAAGLEPSEEQQDQLLKAVRKLRGGAVNFGLWQFSAAGGNPAAGRLTLNNADPALASAVLIAESSAEALDYSPSLGMLRAGDTVSLQERDALDVSHRFRVTGPAVDHGTYRSIPVSYVSGSGGAPAVDTMLSVLLTQAGASDAAVPLFAVQWWPSRASIPAGYAPADGQALPRATFPDAWAGILAGNVPTVAEATWQSTAAERGKYTSGDGASTFRLPDYNGKAAGSLGAVFLRGDGTLSAAVAGAIQLDEIRKHRHPQYEYDSGDSTPIPDGSFAYDLNANIATGYGRTALIGYAGGAETRPLNVTGCWIVKLFGAVNNPGSADAAQLATDYAALAARVSILEQLPFISGQQVITAGGALTIPHGLGVRPLSVVMDGVCVTADLGYSPGDYFYDINGAQVNLNGMTAITADAVNIYVRFGSTAPSLPNKSTGAGASITAARWGVIFRASKR